MTSVVVAHHVASAAAADVFTADSGVDVVPRRTAFELVTGVQERDYRRALIGQDVEGQFWIKNTVTNRTWCAGRFIDPSIGELRAMVQEGPVAEPKRKKKRKEKEGARVPGRFNVVVGYSFAPAALRQLDVAALQANPENNGAVFQVASRFECLEGAGEDLTSYTENGAQGELAAISVMPGTIVRRYVLPDINLLRDLDHPAFTLHGRGVVKHLSFQGIRAQDLAVAAAFDTNLVRVGVHNSDVSFGLVDKRLALGRGHGTHELCKEVQEIISIYTSAVDMHVARGLGRAETRLAETIARRMLISSYEGTILAAAVYGKQKNQGAPRQQLFLTLMGCGVFGNRLEWVAEAIEHCMPDIEALGLDVTLVVFNGNDPRVENMPEFLASMRAHVGAIGGAFTEVR